eukprot:COSAG06_NODE_22050_length_736_cov_0.850863_1_plen_32_part_10
MDDIGATGAEESATLRIEVFKCDSTGQGSLGA